MPTYEYLCDACGHRFEQFQSITASALRKCPACGKAKLRRLIGVGAAVLFKGGGFYETDYRSESYRKAAEADRGAAESPEAKADAKPEAAASGAAEKPSGGGAAPPASATPAPATPAPASPARSGKSHAREGRGVGNLRSGAGGGVKPAKQPKPSKQQQQQPPRRQGGGGRRGR